MSDFLSQVAISNLRNKAIASKKNQAQIVQPLYTIPDDPKARELLARLILQEAIETVHAFGFHPQSLEDRENFVLTPTKSKEELDIYEIIDGACDTVYTAVGALCAMGVPDILHLSEVCQANDAKFPKGEAIINEVGKYQKPEGWVPPDHKKIMSMILEDWKINPLWMKKLSESLMEKSRKGGYVN
jgi:hypothetical protein